MIEAMVFDLDGTLVQTERLKADSYAQAVVELCPGSIEPGEVIEAFKQVVGRSRREVAHALMARFGLEERARQIARAEGLSAPWQAFVQVRLRRYEALLDDPRTLQENQWPHNVALLQQARRDCRRVALATMSDCRRTRQVLQVLGLEDAFDFVASKDDVSSGKPDPEIYQLVAQELEIDPSACLAIEDSPNGVRAAQAAGMHVVAVTTPFTRAQFRAESVLARDWVVDDPATLTEVVRQRLAQARGG